MFPTYAGSGFSGAGDQNNLIAHLAEQPAPVLWVPMGLTMFALLALTVMVTNTGESFSLDE